MPCLNKCAFFEVRIWVFQYYLFKCIQRMKRIKVPAQNMVRELDLKCNRNVFPAKISCVMRCTEWQIFAKNMRICSYLWRRCAHIGVHRKGKEGFRRVQPRCKFITKDAICKSMAKLLKLARYAHLTAVSLIRPAETRIKNQGRSKEYNCVLYMPISFAADSCINPSLKLFFWKRGGAHLSNCGGKLVCKFRDNFNCQQLKKHIYMTNRNKFWDGALSWIRLCPRTFITAAFLVCKVKLPDKQL